MGVEGCEFIVGGTGVERSPATTNHARRWSAKRVRMLAAGRRAFFFIAMDFCHTLTLICVLCMYSGCQAGRFSNVSESITCMECEAGKFSSSAQSVCALCAVGSFLTTDSTIVMCVMPWYIKSVRTCILAFIHLHGQPIMICTSKLCFMLVYVVHGFSCFMAYMYMTSW